VVAGQLAVDLETVGAIEVEQVELGSEAVGAAEDDIGRASNERAGTSLSEAGDVNGDGLDDLIIGGGFGDGEAYVVFGSADGFGTEFDLLDLDGSNGFQINGELTGDNLGTSVSAAGDVNGDGIDDLIVGGPGADDNGSNSGEAYVIFGSTDPFAANVEVSDLDGSNGFTLRGVSTGDEAGDGVAGVGDVNGDGVDDLLVAASQADDGAGTDPLNRVGEAYVVFGSTTGFSTVVELSSLSADDGYAIFGVFEDDQVGTSVAGGGDVNGDGIPDMLLGAPTAGSSAEGETYVVFGENAVNDPPEAFDDAATTNQVNGVNIDVFDDNGFGADRDVDPGDTISVTRAEGQALSNNTQIDLAGGGRIIFTGADRFLFDPAGDFDDLGFGQSRNVTFEYEIEDGSGATDTATVTVNVTGVNDSPTATDDTFATDEDTTFVGDVTADNGGGVDFDIDFEDTFTVASVDDDDDAVGVQVEAFGGGLVTVFANGEFRFDPNGEFEFLAAGEGAAVQVDYEIEDERGLRTGATATITVTGVNDQPDAIDDDISVGVEETVTGNLITGFGEDSDPDDSDELTVSAVNGATSDVGQTITLASGATLLLQSDGTFLYDPNGGFDDLGANASATESFTYSIEDGNGGSDTATAIVTVSREGLREIG
ncbi:MAG: Ig-like domain-containing protein, partial [Pseudomonadota bacterium]